MSAIWKMSLRAAPAVAGSVSSQTVSPGKLPARGEFIIQNAHVMTMEPGVGDIADGSVHVRNGEIVAVGRNLSTPGAEVIKGDGMIVMPGLIDTHWHCWNTLFRSFAGDEQAHGYFPTVARFGQNMTPDDMYHSTRLSAAEAINSGTTFIHDWCHNVRSMAHADGDLRALRETGVRARFSCGWPQGLADTQQVDQQPLENFAADWKNYANEGLISLGMAWRGQFRVQPIPEEIHRPEFDNARRLGLPITVHCGSTSRSVGQLANLANANLLGTDVQIIHALAATADDIAAIKRSGASISVSPGSELRIGYGFPLSSEWLAADVPLGISTDTSALTGSANLFAALKLMRDVANAKAEDEFKMTARQALEVGTIGGARSMAVDDQIGSLHPGKRADLIMISTNTLNMAVMTDPAHLVLECTEPTNVDTVVVDGRILKRGGELTAISTQDVIDGARAALAGVRERTKWR
jgi:cytosine/adenosine deaminase-related metal-dependent hydrolase